MSDLVQSPSADTSVASSQFSHSEDMAVSHVKKYVKDLLRSRIFLGRYLERRLADKQIGYRDIVLISAAETELQRDLIDVHQKIRSVYPNFRWIGITDSNSLGLNVSSGLCLWTEIDNQPFGAFWFQIKSIKFREHEILLALHCIRHISDSYIELEPILTGSAKFKSKKKTNENQVEEVKASVNESIEDIKETLKSALSITNLKELSTFLFAFVIAIFTGSVAFVNFLGNFILSLLREISLLVKNSTPLLLGFLEFLSKIVGGFYILMAMVFRPSNPRPIDKRSITYMDDTNYHRRREFD